MIKSVIKSLFRSVGFEIQRVNVNKQRWSNSFINVDRLKNHNPSIDLLKYSDRKVFFVGNETLRLKPKYYKTKGN